MTLAAAVAEGNTRLVQNALGALVQSGDRAHLETLRGFVRDARDDGPFYDVGAFAEAILALGGDGEVAFLLTHHRQCSFLFGKLAERAVPHLGASDLAERVGAHRALAAAPLALRVEHRAALVAALSSSEVELRRGVLEAFVEPEMAAVVRDRLCELLRAHDAAVDGFVFQALERWADSDDVHGALVAYLQHAAPAKGASELVEWSLGTLRRSDAGARAVIAQSTMSRDAEVRRKALETIGRLDLRAFGDTVVLRAREDRSDRVRAVARSLANQWDLTWRGAEPLPPCIVEGWVLAAPRAGDEQHLWLKTKDDSPSAPVRFIDEHFAGALWNDTRWAVKVTRATSDSPTTLGHRLVAMEPLDALVDAELAPHRAALETALNVMLTPWTAKAHAPVSALSLFAQPAFWEAWFDAFFLVPTGKPEVRFVGGDIDAELEKIDGEEARLLALVVDAFAFSSMRERLFRAAEVNALSNAVVLPPMTAEEDATFARHRGYMPAYQVFWGRVRAANIEMRLACPRDYALVIELDVIGISLELAHPKWHRAVPLGHRDPHHALPVFSAPEWERIRCAAVTVEGRAISATHLSLLLAPFAAPTKSDDTPALRVALETELLAVGSRAEMAAGIAARWAAPWAGRFWEHETLGCVNDFRYSLRAEAELAKNPARARKFVRFLRAMRAR